MSQIIKRAFLVGINYRGTQFELRGCINDVNTIKELLINVYGYGEENILVLSDDTDIKPTGKNILRGWKWLVSKKFIE
jgi:metacaspase-1